MTDYSGKLVINGADITSIIDETITSKNYIKTVNGTAPDSTGNVSINSVENANNATTASKLGTSTVGGSRPARNLRV